MSLRFVGPVIVSVLFCDVSSNFIWCLGKMEFVSVAFSRYPDSYIMSFRVILNLFGILGRWDPWLWPLVGVPVQSTLVILNSKGLSEILRDIRTSTYQICRVQENIIRLTIFNKYIWIGLLKLEIYWKYCGKEGKLLLRSICSSFPQYFYLLLDFHV